MIFELLKFGLVFFLPTILGKAVRFVTNFKPSRFSILSWSKLNRSEKLANLLIILYMAHKLFTTFIYGPPNFFSTVNVRVDAPSYMIRNQYRSFVSKWASSDPNVAAIVGLKQQNADLGEFEDRNLLKEFEEFEFLSEQLKIKDKKVFYYKFGEDAFLNCKYCTTDYDYLLFLVPATLFEYCLFLVVIGFLSNSLLKSKWRGFGLALAFMNIIVEAFAYLASDRFGGDLFDLIFGEDLLTIKHEKILFVRNLSFVAFSLIVLIFDYGQDLRLQEFLSNTRHSLETSLALLQSNRLHKAALSTDETLLKFFNESNAKKPDKFSSIISDPNFRQRVSEMGSQMEHDKLMEQNNENLDKLFKISFRN